MLWSSSVNTTKQPNEERIINNKHVNCIYKLRNKCELNHNQNAKKKGKAKVAWAKLPASTQEREPEQRGQPSFIDQESRPQVFPNPPQTTATAGGKHTDRHRQHRQPWAVTPPPNQNNQTGARDKASATRLSFPLICLTSKI